MKDRRRKTEDRGQKSEYGRQMTECRLFYPWTSAVRFPFSVFCPLSSVLCLLLSVFCLLSSPVYADSRVEGRSLSTDEMLKYTLTDLRQQMQKAAEVNKKLAGKNNAIRKRIHFLRQQRKKYKNDKSGMGKKFESLSDTIQSESKSSSLMKEQTQKLAARQDQMRRERQEMKREIREKQKKQGYLKKKAEDSKNKITELKRRVQETRITPVGWKQEKEKNKLLTMFNKNRSKVKRSEKEVALLEKQLRAPMQRKGVLLQRQGFLKQQLRQAQASLQDEMNRRKQFKTVSLTFEKSENKEIQQVHKEIARLKRYHKELTEAIEESREIRKEIVFQSKARPQRMNKLKESLGKETRLLSENIEAAQRSVELMEDLKEEIKKKVILEKQKVKDLEGQRKRVEEQQQRIERQIQDSQDERGSLKKNMTGLNNEIAKLRRELRNEDVSSIRQKYKEEKSRLRQLWKKNRTTLKREGQERSLLEEQLAGLKKETEDFLEEKGFLKQKLKKAEEDLQVESDREQELESASLDYADQKIKNMRQARQEIAQLKEYHEGLEDAFMRFQDVHAIIDSKFAPYDWKMLEKKNQLLAENVEVARRSVGLIEDFKKEIKRKVFLKKKRMKDLEGQQNRIEGEQQKIQEQISGSRKKQDLLKRDMTRLKTEIEKLQERLGNGKFSVVKKEYKQAKDALGHLWEEKRTLLKRAEHEIALSEKRLVRSKKRKEEYFATQRSLKEELRQRHEDLQSDVDKKYKLNRTVWDLRDQEKKKIKQVKKEMTRLEVYRDGLEDALVRFQDVYKTIVSQHGPQNRQLNELRRFLGQENRLLAENVEVALRSLRWGEDLKEEARRQISLMATKVDLAEQGNRLNGIQDNIWARISEQQKDQQRLDDQKEDLTRGIEQLEDQLQASHLRGEVPLKGEEMTQGELSKRLQKYTQENRTRQEKIVSLKKNVDYSNKALVQSRERQDYLDQRLRAAKADLHHLRAQKSAVLRQQRRKVKEPLRKVTQQINQEIEALKTRHTVLSSSLSVIKSKYNVKALHLGKSKKEKMRLNKYLALLKQKNKSLRERVSTVTASLDKLEIKKAGYGGPWEPGADLDNP